MHMCSIDLNEERERWHSLKDMYIQISNAAFSLMAAQSSLPEAWRLTEAQVFVWACVWQCSGV